VFAFVKIAAPAYNEATRQFKQSTEMCA